MPWTKLNLKIIQVSLALWLSLLWSNLSLAAFAMAYVRPNEHHWENFLQQFDEHPLEDIRQEFEEQKNYRRQTAGTKRCPSSANLIVIIPRNVWGFTTNPFPQFFFYLVRYSDDEPSIEFSLTKNTNEQTENTNDQIETIYQATFKTALEQYQIGYISLPQEASLVPLEVNQAYNWKFRIFSEDDPGGSAVTGKITRVQLSPETTTQLEQKTPLEQARIYSSLGVWYDALAILARLRLEEPENQNIRREWEELLESVELDTLDTKIATAPLMSEESTPTEISNKCL